MNRSRTAVAEALEPLAMFVLVYTAFLWIVVSSTHVDAVGYHYWGLLAACVATILCCRASRAVRREFSDAVRMREVMRGTGMGLGVVSSTALLVVITGSSSHTMGEGFPLAIVALFILPAAIHEELVFRGVGFGALRLFGDTAALVCTSILFAVMHIGNAHAGPIALANILLGGWFLGAIRIRWGIFASIAAHFTWNVTTGPLLGYHVSGWTVPETLLSAHPAPPAWWSGAEFGLEGGLAMSLVLLTGVISLERGRLRAARVKMHQLSDGETSPDNSQETGFT